MIRNKKECLSRCNCRYEGPYPLWLGTSTLPPSLFLLGLQFEGYNLCHIINRTGTAHLTGLSFIHQNNFKGQVKLIRNTVRHQVYCTPDETEWDPVHTIATDQNTCTLAVSMAPWVWLQGWKKVHSVVWWTHWQHFNYSKEHKQGVHKDYG